MNLLEQLNAYFFKKPIQISMLNIKIPNLCRSEQHYALDIMLREFLGLEFVVETYSGEVIEIARSDDLGKVNCCPAKMTLDISFFQQAKKAWLKPESMPDLPLKSWIPAKDGVNANLIEASLPVIYGLPGLVKNGEHFHLNIDIFGSAFFMLSRYEELVSKDRDQHNRFPSSGSVAFKENFLDRPIINEYLEILWECLHQLWPDLKRKERQANNFITCDADWPFDPTIYSLKGAVIKSARLLIKEMNPIASMRSLFAYITNKLGLKLNDSYVNSINWMMEVNEAAGNSMAFYFITKNTSKLDTMEDFDSFKMRALFREISNRGHEIGIHPGYETYNNPENFKKTVDELRRLLEQEGIQQNSIGGRQHFLRWDAAQTPHLWEQNGLAYDSTLSYADRSGFRSGICYDYKMYDIVNRQPFKLKQLPLIVMESTVIAQRYEGLGYSRASFDRFMYFKNTCHKYSGTFSLLWHNCHFENKKDKIFYMNLVL